MPAPAHAPLVLTQGDPDGVGPELLLRVAQAGELRAGDRIVADEACLQRWATALGGWADDALAALRAHLLPAPAGLDAVQALTRGVDLVLAEPGHGLVTAPIDKARCHALGFGFPGHTEYLAHRAGDCEVAMCLAGPVLRVALATIHIPLRQVPEVLSVADVERAGRLLAAALRDDFGIDTPRIAVLGLNPHAGEGGLLGDEEARIIAPAIEQLRRGLADAARFTGPLPADTAFAAQARGDYDGVLAMYHDQGLGPFKLLHFTDGINVTLGLPFRRTSPDHGTARDIAGRGIADPTSMLTAVRVARGGFA